MLRQPSIAIRLRNFASGSVQLSFGFGFHLPEPGVVISKFLEMSMGDLGCHHGVVSGHVRSGVVRPVLQFHFHAHVELFDIERGIRPVDPDALTQLPGLIKAELLSVAHRTRLTPVLHQPGPDPLNQKDLLARGGPSVDLAVIAGARFVSQGDTRILEKVAT